MSTVFAVDDSVFYKNEQKFLPLEEAFNINLETTSNKKEVNLVLSNEPGYYKKNHFGIRIENLVYVKRTKDKLKFEDLTLVPIDKSLIEKNLLTSFEKGWLNKYHQRVFVSLKKFMNKLELAQLKQSCSNI